MGKIIALNRMYAGEYIKDENNIGHEIINLFKTDSGENYVYLQPYGNYGSAQDGRFEAILLVRGLGNGIFEVLGKAEGLTSLPVLSEYCGGSRYDRKEKAMAFVHARQLDEVKSRAINYGGVSVDKLYRKNKNDDVCIYATFKAEKIRLPQKALYFTDDKSKEDVAKSVYYIKTENGFARQQLKMYFEEGTDGYNTLRSVLDSDKLWQKQDTTEKIGDMLYLGDKEITFLDVIKKNDDEVVFSNLIAYYLAKYKPLLKKFIDEFCDGRLSGEISVCREKYHIDILLKDENGNCVIIENKIKSGVNGIVRNESGEIEKNQLKTYIDSLIKLDSTPDEKISGLVLIPNYCRIDFGEYECSDRYKRVTYKQLYEFFKQWVFGIGDFSISDPYYVDFVKALKIHSKEVNNTLQEEMKRRFVKSILDNRA